MTPFLPCNALALGPTMMAANFAMTLAGSEWQPVTLEGAQIENGRQLFVRFGTGGRLEGHSACRAFSGRYRVDVAAITIELSPPSEPDGGAPVCAPKDLEIEARFLAALEHAARFDRDRIRLTLWDRAGRIAAELQQTDWD